MVWRAQNAGIARYAFPVDVIPPWSVVLEFLLFVGHAQELEHNTKAVILSFLAKAANPSDFYDL